jgi:Ethanolamine utilization protein EutJ (predicted chaperonin)
MPAIYSFKNLFMKSSIKIGIDHENKPVLNIYAEWTDDPRDQLIWRFMDALQVHDGEQSSLAEAKVEVSGSGRDTGTAFTITPTTHRK